MAEAVHPIPPLVHQGRRYSGTYVVRGDWLEVTHGPTTKKAALQGLPAAPLALQLLYEIVVREGKGVPDRPDRP